MKMGASDKGPTAIDSAEYSLARNRPVRIECALMRAREHKRRCANCSFDISSEKIAQG